jgi:hypothetical protein
MNAIEQRLGTWIPQVQGQYINMDWNPTNKGFGAQCWDLAAHWSAFLGLPIINTGGKGRWPGWAGNMVDAFPQTPAIAAAYTLHGPGETGQGGDIAVWGDSYWWYPSTHVAVLYADNGSWLTCMSQNSTPSRADNPYPGDSSGPTTIQSLPRQGLIGFIRPRLGGISPQGTTITPIQEDDPLANFSEADISRIVQEAIDGWAMTSRRFPDNRNLLDQLIQTRTDIGAVHELLKILPASVLYNERVDGRNLFDWLKQLRSDVVGIQPGSVDVAGIAKALAEQLPKADAEALVDALADRLAK